MRSIFLFGGWAHRFVRVLSLALALVAAPFACKREAKPKPQAGAILSAALVTYKPSAEPGIRLTVGGAKAALAGKRVVLTLIRGSSGSGASQGEGLYVTDDGLVFSYTYELPEDETQPVTPCDIRRFKAGSPELYECLHRSSELRAKLDQAFLSSLLVDLARVAESERVEWPYPIYDGGGARLEVPGRGYKGSALDLASCGSSNWQLSSPEASRIINMFRRLRRALGGRWRSVSECPDYFEARKEIVSGVRAWWSYEE
jgi:hypothetical protein